MLTFISELSGSKNRKSILISGKIRNSTKFSHNWMSFGRRRMVLLLLYLSEHWHNVSMYNLYNTGIVSKISVTLLKLMKGLFDRYNLNSYLIFNTFVTYIACASSMGKKLKLVSIFLGRSLSFA